MIDWLKRFLARQPAEGEADPPQATEEALRAGYRQAALHHLSQGDGLMPVYRHDIRSEEGYEAAIADMPLIVVWGERRTHDGVAFSISVNVDLVEDAFTQYMHELDPWLDEECHLLLSQLKSLTERSLSSTISQTGMMPSDICEQLTSSRPAP